MFFVAASSVGGAVFLAAVTVHVLGLFDPKYRDAIQLAFQLELFGMLSMAFLVTVAYWLALGIAQRRNPRFAMRPAGGAIGSAVGMVLLWLAGLLSAQHAESESLFPVVAMGVVLVAWFLSVCFVLTRRRVEG
jgi:lipopolysaccharide export LptBFGC system permease protein LptF